MSCGLPTNSMAPGTAAPTSIGQSRDIRRRDDDDPSGEFRRCADMLQIHPVHIVGAGDIPHDDPGVVLSHEG